MNYAEFEAEMLKEDSFHETIQSLQWLARDDMSSMGMQVGVLRHMFKRYIASNKKFESDPNRISSGQASRRLS